ncbi:MAG: hypothetical protein K2M03_00450 [Muribaculaceae bacterium]|nr:hypothetical protein [Muribaculaceae bacterium]
MQSDINEILRVAPELDLFNNDIFVYYLTNNQAPALYQTEYDKTSGIYKLVKRKDYDRSQYSTDPRRIRGVIEDYLHLSPADTYGLIFWSHGTGWTPYFSDHKVNQSEVSQSGRGGVYKSFGYDSYNGTVDQCDIIELAEAVPEDIFHYIWFDCCYMGGIETVYQLRDKADYMVAYCTEVWGDGMQYTLTMPYLVNEQPDLKGAAKAFSDYYINQQLAVTVGVYDLSQVEGVAEVAAERFNLEPAPVVFMQNYGRQGYDFYDFGQYLKSKMIETPEKWSTSVFDSSMSAFDDIQLNAALSKLVVFKQSADINFNRSPLSLDYFSGLSVHYFKNENTEKDAYYQQTDWYKRISRQSEFPDRD